MSLHSIFHTVAFFSMVIASYLFFYLLLIHARKAARLDMLVIYYRATWNALEVLNLFKLVLVILVNLAFFSDAIFFTFSHIFFYYISSCGWRFIYLSLPFLLCVSGL